MLLLIYSFFEKMIRIADEVPVKIASINIGSEQLIHKKRTIHHILSSCYKQQIEYDKWINLLSPYMVNVYVINQIVSYISEPRYKTMISCKEKSNNFILPYYKYNNFGGVDLYAVKDGKRNIVWKIDNDFVSCINQRLLKHLYFSHEYIYNKRRYACLEFRHLSDLFDIKTSYKIVYRLMCEYNEMDNNTTKQLLREWFEGEIDSFMYKIYTMSKETINCNLDYINKDLNDLTMHDDFNEVDTYLL